MVLRRADPTTHHMGVVTVIDSSLPSNIAVLPRVLHELSEIQRHVLARVVVHRWNHGGSIPFVAPNVHQSGIAMSLAAPDVRLLVASCGGRRLPSFTLSRLGEHAARRVLRLVPADLDWAREIEFDRIRALMRNDWEVIGA